MIPVVPKNATVDQVNCVLLYPRIDWTPDQLGKQDGIFVGISSGATTGHLMRSCQSPKGSATLCMPADDDLNWHCEMPIWIVLHRIERTGQSSGGAV